MKNLKLKRPLIIVAFVLTTIAFVPLEGQYMLGWMMGCAWGTPTDAEYAECRHYVDLHFGVPIVLGLVIWGALLWAAIRFSKDRK